MDVRHVVFHRRNGHPAQIFSVVVAFCRPQRSRAVRGDRRWRQREPRNAVEDRAEQVPRHRYLSELERDVLGVLRHLGPDLHQLLSQRRQRPMLYWVR